MENLDSQWRNFLRNLGLYLLTMVILVVSLRFLRSYGLLLLWGVGLIWGGLLAYHFSQLLFGQQEETSINKQAWQNYLDQAENYKTQIDNALKTGPGHPVQPHQEQLAGQIETWTRAITELVHRLNSLHQDETIRQDLQTVPQAITDLEERLAEETDPDLRVQMERTLANRQKQLASLNDLQNMISHAEIQIENTLSMLGTIYSQILTSQSTNQVADYSRLSADVDEELYRLQDQLDALREVKLDRE